MKSPVRIPRPCLDRRIRGEAERGTRANMNRDEKGRVEAWRNVRRLSDHARLRHRVTDRTLDRFIDEGRRRATS